MPAAANIFVVEDNAVMANVVRFNLMRGGYCVELAPDGRTALERLRAGAACDLLVTDYQMPHLDGAGLCRALRQEERFRGLPVLLVSAKGLELDVDGLHDELGIADVMSKPFSPRELVERVGEILARSAAAC